MCMCVTIFYPKARPPQKQESQRILYLTKIIFFVTDEVITLFAYNSAQPSKILSLICVLCNAAAQCIQSALI